jgi:hypothetical protein
LNMTFGIQPDNSFRPVFVGAMIREKSKHGYIHERVDCVAFRAPNTKLQYAPSGSNPEWVPVATLSSIPLDKGIEEHKRFAMENLVKKGEKYVHLMKLKQIQSTNPTPMITKEIKDIERDIVGFDVNEEQRNMPVASLLISDIEELILKNQEDMKKLREIQEITDTDSVIHQGEAFNRYHLVWLGNVLKGRVLNMRGATVPQSDKMLFIIGSE